MRKAPPAPQKVVKSDGSIIDPRAARDFATKKKISIPVLVAFG